jgi:hypothetical protein
VLKLHALRPLFRFLLRPSTAADGHPRDPHSATLKVGATSGARGVRFRRAPQSPKFDCSSCARRR